LLIFGFVSDSPPGEGWEAALVNPIISQASVVVTREASAEPSRQIGARPAYFFAIYLSQ
jgi:hypothetical protein